MEKKTHTNREHDQAISRGEVDVKVLDCDGHDRCLTLTRLRTPVEIPNGSPNQGGCEARDFDVVEPKYATENLGCRECDNNRRDHHYAVSIKLPA